MQGKRLIVDGKRLDGRAPDELRPVKLKVGVLKRADGSAYIEMGENKILVAVYGPQELHPRHLQQPEAATLRCRYNMAPFSVPERKKPGFDRRSMEISKVVREALEPVLFLNLYPRSVIDLYIEVLQADAGTRVAGVTASSVALADAGIPIRDLVSGVSVGKVDGTLVLDLNSEEDQNGETDMPVAMTGRDRRITLLQMDGELTREEFRKALELATKGCEQLYELQKQALKEKYASLKVGE
ncbi:MAG: exosome complex exonuclease Rrp41 [Candidatus Hadarchaeales archaeon]